MTVSYGLPRPLAARRLSYTALHSLARKRENGLPVGHRPGHDRRYSIDSAKLRALGWSPEHDFASAIEKTVAWYRDNRPWWEKVKSGHYQEYYQRMYGRRLSQARPYEG